MLGHIQPPAILAKQPRSPTEDDDDHEDEDEDKHEHEQKD